jgi:hypothetical protein
MSGYEGYADEGYGLPSNSELLVIHDDEADGIEGGGARRALLRVCGPQQRVAVRPDAAGVAISQRQRGWCVDGQGGRRAERASAANAADARRDGGVPVAGRVARASRRWVLCQLDRRSVSVRTHAAAAAAAVDAVSCVHAALHFLSAHRAGDDLETPATLLKNALLASFLLLLRYVLFPPASTLVSFQRHRCCTTRVLRLRPPLPSSPHVERCRQDQPRRLLRATRQEVRAVRGPPAGRPRRPRAVTVRTHTPAVPVALHSGGGRTKRLRSKLKAQFSILMYYYGGSCGRRGPRRLVASKTKMKACIEQTSRAPAEPRASARKQGHRPVAWTL